MKDATYAVYAYNRRSSFNPRVREGRDNEEAFISQSASVSIHASVKDATLVAELAVVNDLVSIHASVKDATRMPCFAALV